MCGIHNLIVKYAMLDEPKQIRTSALLRLFGIELKFTQIGYRLNPNTLTHTLTYLIFIETSKITSGAYLRFV